VTIRPEDIKALGAMAESKEGDGLARGEGYVEWMTRNGIDAGNEFEHMAFAAAHAVANKIMAGEIPAREALMAAVQAACVMGFEIGWRARKLAQDRERIGEA